MEWRDQGVLLTVRRHGESSAIIEVFTTAHGRHAGVVRGGAGRRMSPILQPGAQLDLTWRARLEDHLGAFTVEPLASRAALMAGRLPLAGLNAITALLSFCLPERESHPLLYARSIALLDLLGDNDDWPLAYLHWEQALLEETGFGLDLTSCAATGSFDDLAYVSPRTGRAVSRQGAGEWADRLLPLPLCMLGQGTASAGELQEGLRTTGHFLETHLAPSLGNRPLPAARQRLIDLFRRHF
ncbi:DNA repair protein RecO [Oceaniglobus trochenteri]|uniref:DNA repair protein RecO n=1 Tax=Oceaniglobus trochenteri TaxID=2763260 RepID=UPI001D000FA6|nr:DNA repair protein RecO [Oceaniglobus trochenteri]